MAGVVGSGGGGGEMEISVLEQQLKKKNIKY